MATVARVAIIVYAVFAALTQLGIAVQLTANTLLIVLGGVALGAAIAFGFGAQNVAHDIVERAYERRRDEVRGGSTATTTLFSSRSVNSEVSNCQNLMSFMSTTPSRLAL